MGNLDYAGLTDFWAKLKGRLDAKADKSELAGRNLLDNGNFRNPVNQRGQTSYTTGWGYALDRWYLSDSRGAGAENQTLEIVEGGVRLTGGHPSIVQRIELKQLDSARSYTVYACDTSGALRPGSVTFYSQYGFAQVHIIVPSGVTLQWAAMYEGAYTADTLPAYASKDYGAELTRCQRYFLDVIGQWSGYAYGSYVHISIPTPAQMRINPTVALGAGEVMLINAIAARTAVTQALAYGNNVELQIGLSAESGAAVANYNGRITLSAEL